MINRIPKFLQTKDRHINSAASVMLALLFFALAALAPAANVERIGQLLSGQCGSILIQNHYALVGNSQLTVWDVTRPLEPSHVTDLALPGTGSVTSMALAGNRLYLTKYVSSTQSGLEIVDVSNPAAPASLGSILLSVTPYWVKVAASGTLACLATGQEGLRIVDAANPTTPTLRGLYPVADISDVATSGALACLATASGLRVLSVSDPTSPTQVGALPGLNVFSVRISGGLVYAATDKGLAVISLADPAHPAQLNTAMPPVGRAFTIEGNLLYSGDDQGNTSIIDITDPAHPVPRGSFSTGTAVSALACYNQTLYVAAGSNGMELLDVHDPAHPASAAYLPGASYSACFLDKKLFVAQSRGIMTLDLTNPAAPVTRGLYRLAGTTAIMREGHLLYAFAGSYNKFELIVLDAANPTSLTLLGRCAVNRYQSSTPSPQVSNGLVLTNSYEGYSALIDVHEPARPHVMTTLGPPDSSQTIRDGAFGPPGIIFSVSMSNSGSSGQLRVLDVNNPSAPRVINSVQLNSFPLNLAFHDGRLFVNTLGKSLIFDASDPLHLRLLDFYPVDASTSCISYFLRLGNRWVGIKVTDQSYSIDTNDPLSLIDLADFAHPRLLGRLPAFRSNFYPYFPISVNAAADEAILFNGLDLSIYRLRADAVPLTILDPARAVTVAGGASLPVHWQIDKPTAGTTARFELVNAAGLVASLGEGVAESGETTTTLRVPVLPAGRYRLRAASTAQPAMTTESLDYITITGTGVNLFEPAGGETFQSSQAITAHWEGFPTLAGAQVRFELWRGWNKIAVLGTAAVGGGKTNTQLNLPANLAPGTNYFLLAISQSDKTVFARNPAPFTITK